MRGNSCHRGTTYRAIDKWDGIDIRYQYYD